MGKPPFMLFAMLFLLLQTVAANDCSIGTDGGNVFIEDDQDIAMARRGYVFEDKELAALFSGKPWYKPDKGFKLDMVSKEERETIAEIKRIEDRK